VAAFGFDQRELGQSAFLSEAISVMQGVPGVDYVNITVFDSVADDIAPTQLAALAGTLIRRNFVKANLARVNSLAAPSDASRFTPAELVFLTPDIADTLILTEITATNPGPPPARRQPRARASLAALSPARLRTSVVYSRPSFPAGGTK
jgi:hypothetical protein